MNHSAPTFGDAVKGFRDRRAERVALPEGDGSKAQRQAYLLVTRWLWRHPGQTEAAACLAVKVPRALFDEAKRKLEARTSEVFAFTRWEYIRPREEKA